MEKFLEIILYFSCICTISFSQAYTIYFINLLLCKKKFPKKNLIISFLSFIPVSFLLIWVIYNLPNLSFIKSLTGIAAMSLISYFLYKRTLLHTVIVTALGTSLCFLFDMLMVIIITLFFNNITDMNQIVDNKTLYYLVNIITNIVSISVLKLTLLILNKFLKFSNKNTTTTKLDYKTILYQGTIIIITLIPSMYLIFANNYNYAIPFVIVNTLQLIVVSIFSFFYIRKRILFKDTELELENTKLHNKALSTINENIRGFKHDMGNMVQSINGYLAVGNIEGVKNYCQNLLHGFNDINLLSILSPKIINDPAIYGIVVGKMLHARENDLTLSLDIGLDVSKINFPSFELSRIIGILLDNAIEASLESDEHKIKLEMYHDENRNQDIIIIGNSVKNPDKIDIIKMFEKNYSTKENPSGFGLYEVLKFFKKNNKGDIVPNIDYDSNFFTQTLIFDR